jgi:hypothetical protein
VISRLAPRLRARRRFSIFNKEFSRFDYATQVVLS